MIRRRLAYWRRRWCMWRGHPMVKHQLVVSFRDADWLDPATGLIVPGDEIEQWSMRCARHGKAVE